MSDEDIVVDDWEFPNAVRYKHVGDAEDAHMWWNGMHVLRHEIGDGVGFFKIFRREIVGRDDTEHVQFGKETEQFAGWIDHGRA